jgi:hypothetical protein
MNSALKASMRGVSERTIYSVTGIVAFAGAAIALLIIAVVRVPFGVLVTYALWPFAVALLAWTILGLARLRLVGFLPSEAEGLVPGSLQPWIRAWLMTRFGLLGSMLILILVAVALGIMHGPLAIVIQAFVSVAWFRMFLDLILGAMFNAGVISTRN